jgi:hypothetical protein
VTRGGIPVPKGATAHSTPRRRSRLGPPLRHLQPEDEVVFELFRARLHVVGPPADRSRDPCPGSKEPRGEANDSV